MQAKIVFNGSWPSDCRRTAAEGQSDGRRPLYVKDTYTVKSHAEDFKCCVVFFFSTLSDGLTRETPPANRS